VTRHSNGDAALLELRATNGRKAASDSGPIYDAIREGILSGRYPAGERLVEARLATELNVSRTRVREGLARLEAEHLLARVGGRGLIVARLSPSDIEDAYALRLLLEGFAARRAAENITTDELERLRELQRQMTEAEEGGRGETGQGRLKLVRTVTELNKEFHHLIHLAARNRRLEPILRSVVDVPLMFTSFYWYSDRELAEAANDHQLILDALEARDPEKCEELMKRHVSRGLNTLRRELRGGA